MFSWWLLEALRGEPSADSALVGIIYTRVKHWLLPAQFPDAYLINMACGWAAGEHWVGVFLEDSWHAEYFDSYSTALLESIKQRLWSMGYQDIWYNTKMLQGRFSGSCGLYAFYFLAMHSQSVPLGAITGAFQEYDFAYDEAQIRRLLGWHT